MIDEKLREILIKFTDVGGYFDIDAAIPAIKALVRESVLVDVESDDLDLFRAAMLERWSK